MANMFRCTLASGGSVLTVTCDSTFAGQTITCTDGTTTLTQTCPSISPYTVEFRIPNSGTWTISSGTSSTSVTIPSSAELHDIPNGSTITPTDVIQTWLHCGNIWDKNYTTISQVLADATTLQALITSNNAADYMARSTTWANGVVADSGAMTYIGLNNYCANKLLTDATWLNAICNSTYFESVLNVKVPTMTSNTTPSGECISGGYNASGQENYKAFDNNTSTFFASSQNSTGAGAYIGYIFDNAISVKKVDFDLWISYSGSSCNQVIALQGSNDGSTWSDITEISITYTGSTPNKNNVIVSNYANFKYYRIYKKSSSLTTRLGAYRIQFYGR